MYPLSGVHALGSPVSSLARDTYVCMRSCMHIDVYAIVYAYISICVYLCRFLLGDILV